MRTCRVVSLFGDWPASNELRADIVITTNGGYPLDQNIYQSVKGMTAAEATVKEGGVIIIAAECSDGHGGKAFFDAFNDLQALRELMDSIITRTSEETVPDQWESQCSPESFYIMRLS